MTTSTFVSYISYHCTVSCVPSPDSAKMQSFVRLVKVLVPAVMVLGEGGGVSGAWSLPTYRSTLTYQTHTHGFDLFGAYPPPHISF